MGKTAWYVLVLSTIIQLLAVTFCAVWPLLNRISKYDLWDLVRDSYSFRGSNLDVLGISVIESSFVPAFLGILLIDSPIPPFNTVAYCTWGLVVIGQVNSLGFAVDSLTDSIFKQCLLCWSGICC